MNKHEALDLSTLEAKQAWWHQLTPEWKKAFNEVLLQKGPVTDMPADEAGLDWVLECPNFRFAGPKAMHGNMSFELTDLSGLTHMYKAELISATAHQITDLSPITHLTGIKSLFLDNNNLSSLEGVEQLVHLESIFFSDNQIESLVPLANLANLKSVQCSLNKLSSFEGMNEVNTKHSELFVGLPNRVARKEIDRLENDLRVAVRKF